MDSALAIDIELLPTISLVPTRAVMGMRCSVSDMSSKNLDFVATCSRGESIETEDGGSLAGASWSVFLHLSDDHSDHAREIGAVGFLRYSDVRGTTEGSCIASVSIGAEPFQELVEYIKTQGLPARVILTVDGLRRESNKGVDCWNVSERKHLPIYRVEFDMPFTRRFEPGGHPVPTKW